MTDKRCVLLFVKLPEKGRVKSRLALYIGEDAALRLYENMVLDVIDMLTRGRFPFRICFTPPEARDQMTGWLGQERDYLPQTGNDLGERMEEAFVRVFSREVEEVLLIGSDIPGLTSEVIEEAFTAFLTNDAVIGPADDGGYYLIGFRKESFEPRIFHDMAWSTRTVFRETVERLHEASVTLHVLPELTDVDTVEDLRTLMSQVKSPSSRSSRTLSYLVRHQNSILK
ncbi:MAG: TIGR04282 family arsenosugar biosynthesis glycosyltransferase [Nitrospirae bacterium]|nr:TIGR04282 family arsenosugar biosynthesis glycosyltransferase [Nitrospirota bacterium]